MTLTKSFQEFEIQTRCKAPSPSARGIPRDIAGKWSERSPLEHFIKDSKTHPEKNEVGLQQPQDLTIKEYFPMLGNVTEAVKTTEDIPRLNICWGENFAAFLTKRSISLY